MIQRLLETSQTPGRTARIDQRIRDHLVEDLATDMMRAGKSGEQSVRRKQFEGADVQLVVTAQRVVQATFAFRE